MPTHLTTLNPWNELKKNSSYPFHHISQSLAPHTHQAHQCTNHSKLLYPLTQPSKRSWLSRKCHKKFIAKSSRRLRLQCRKTQTRSQNPHWLKTCKKWETYLVLFIFVQNLQRFHGSYHRLHGSEDVLVHQLGEAFFVLFRVAWAMNYTHLLNERAFPTLPSAYRMEESELGATRSKAQHRWKLLALHPSTHSSQPPFCHIPDW